MIQHTKKARIVYMLVSLGEEDRMAWFARVSRELWYIMGRQIGIQFSSSSKDAVLHTKLTKLIQLERHTPRH